MLSKSSFAEMWKNVRWSVLGPCCAALVVGLVLLAFPISEATKYFISGALVGIGAGGGIAEFSGALERGEQRQQTWRILGPVLAQCRLAYRMGEFFFPFYAAISKNERDDRHVKEMLFLGEQLGIRSTLESVIGDANPSDPKLHEILSGQIQEALIYNGQQLPLFFRLGSDILAVRGADAKNDADARSVVVKRIGENLRRVAEYTNNPYAVKSWTHFSTLWDRGVLTAPEIDDLLLAFHVFLLTLGVEEEGTLRWQAVISDLAKLNVGKADRPADLAHILEAAKAGPR